MAGIWSTTVGTLMRRARTAAIRLQNMADAIFACEVPGQRVHCQIDGPRQASIEGDEHHVLFAHTEDNGEAEASQRTS